MRAALVQRQAALAGVALLAGLGAIALQANEPGEGRAPASPVVRWEEARVATFAGEGGETACGVTLTPQTVGVAHPVLPCGVALVLEHDGREVRTEVIQSAPVGAGHAFELTEALARELGVSGEASVRWRFPT